MVTDNVKTVWSKKKYYKDEQSITPTLMLSYFTDLEHTPLK